MNDVEILSGCLKNDQMAKKLFFQSHYGKLAFIASRYSKNKIQANEFTLKGFLEIFHKLPEFKNQSQLDLNSYVKTIFIYFLVTEVKNIRNEYYVASTVKASEEVKDKTYDLFLDSVYIDFRNLDEDLLVESLQALVPSQRLAFNLQIIDGFSPAHISNLLETNEHTVKSNIEKARFHLQKNIEKNLKFKYNGQPV